MVDSETSELNQTLGESEKFPSPQAPLGIRDQEDLPEASLSDLPEKLRLGAAQAGWSQLMPVQAKAIPYLFSRPRYDDSVAHWQRQDWCLFAAILEMVNPLNPTTQALVLVPTRAAHQVATEAELLGGATGVRSIAVYGGVGYSEQLSAFHAGAHLVIGTPGRILDHLLRHSLSLEKLKFLVFDEADRMLSMGFYPDMVRVQAYLPDHHVSTYMFSATFPPQVTGLASQFLQKPGFLNFK